MNKLDLEFVLCKVEENLVEQEKCGDLLKPFTDQTHDLFPEKEFQPFDIATPLNIKTDKNELTCDQVKSHDKLDTEIKQEHMDETEPESLVLGECIKPREKPFSCPQCDATFNTSSHLKRHEMIHSGDKPFSCGSVTRPLGTIMV